MLFVQLNHFVDDDLPQRVQNGQNCDIHDDLLMGPEELVEIEYLSCYQRKDEGN